jgi:hypothetical protein
MEWYKRDDMLFVPHRRQRLWASTACYGESFTVLYVDVVRTLQKTRQRASTTGYWESFTVLYIDVVRTSQETRLCSSTA